MKDSFALHYIKLRQIQTKANRKLSCFAHETQVFLIFFFAKTAWCLISGITSAPYCILPISQRESLKSVFHGQSQPVGEADLCSVPPLQLCLLQRSSKFARSAAPPTSQSVPPPIRPSSVWLHILYQPCEEGVGEASCKLSAINSPAI